MGEYRRARIGDWVCVAGQGVRMMIVDIEGRDLTCAFIPAGERRPVELVYPAGALVLVPAPRG